MWRFYYSTINDLFLKLLNVATLACSQRNCHGAMWTDPINELALYQLYSKHCMNYPLNLDWIIQLIEYK